MSVTFAQRGRPTPTSTQIQKVRSLYERKYLFLQKKQRNRNFIYIVEILKLISSKRVLVDIFLFSFESIRQMEFFDIFKYFID